MNQLSRIYENLKRKNPNLDELRARQQAWVLRDRIILENTAVSSSAAAAGAGAGGAGGGGLKRKLSTQGIDPSTNLYVVDDYIDDYFE